MPKLIRKIAHISKNLSQQFFNLQEQFMSIKHIEISLFLPFVEQIDIYNSFHVLHLTLQHVNGEVTETKLSSLLRFES